MFMINSRFLFHFIHNSTLLLAGSKTIFLLLCYLGVFILKCKDLNPNLRTAWYSIHSIKQNQWSSFYLRCQLLAMWLGETVKHFVLWLKDDLPYSSMLLSPGHLTFTFVCSYNSFFLHMKYSFFKKNKCFNPLRIS